LEKVNLPAVELEQQITGGLGEHDALRRGSGTVEMMFVQRRRSTRWSLKRNRRLRWRRGRRTFLIEKKRKGQKVISIPGRGARGISRGLGG
jgi:hypothetical protein